MQCAQSTENHYMPWHHSVEETSALTQAATLHLLPSPHSKKTNAYDASTRMSKQVKLHLDHLCRKPDVECVKSNVAVDETLDSGRESCCGGELPQGFVSVGHQEKVALLKDSCCMKWHHFSLSGISAFQHLSGKVYETMRMSKCIHLPSQHTLRDYTHYTTMRIGFLSKVDKQIYDNFYFSNECNR